MEVDPEGHKNQMGPTKAGKGKEKIAQAKASGDEVQDDFFSFFFIV